jgi:hypothetical protein
MPLSLDAATILTVIAIALMAFALPVGILVSRNNVKSRRQEIITDLEGFLRPPPGDTTDKEWLILPSFEFVKMKYFMGAKGQQREREFSISVFSIPVLTFVLLSALGFITAFLITTDCFKPDAQRCPMFPQGIPATLFLVGGAKPDDPGRYLQSALTIAVFAFLGGYAYSMRVLLRAVANFDLSPLSFFRQSIYVIVTIFIAVTVWRSMPDWLGDESKGAAFQGWYLAAFLLGFVPGLAERHLVSLWRRGMMKEVDRRAIEATKTVPLEVIDGIDADTRARLEEFNLYDAQHLATANPIMLFVETPFGMYQSIDWVAQAQLVVALGVERYLRLRELGLRTIFDLEDTFRETGRLSADLRCRVARILLDSPAPADEKAMGAICAEGTELALICLAALPTWRLRQIRSTIEDKLKRHGPSLFGADRQAPPGSRPAEPPGATARSGQTDPV